MNNTVEIPDTVTSVGYFAFWNVGSLTDLNAKTKYIKIPASVKTIVGGAETFNAREYYVLNYSANELAVAGNRTKFFVPVTINSPFATCEITGVETQQGLYMADAYKTQKATVTVKSVQSGFEVKCILGKRYEL